LTKILNDYNDLKTVYLRDGLEQLKMLTKPFGS